MGGDTHVVYEQGINFAIRQLRKTLGDLPGSPRFIQTVTKTGYRFIAKAEPLRPTRLRFRLPWRTAGALLVGAVAGVASTPLGCEKQIERFHQFFGIDPQKCLIHRMLTPTQIPQIDARPSPRS